MPRVSSPLTLGKSRIEALSDGVFAIAMTLLVLKLEVPEVMHHSSNEAMLRQLLSLGPAFMTYVVTFLIAGGFWFLHHLTFHFIRQVNGLLVWINLIFLMFVALLPFSAELMGHLLVHPISQLFYFGNLFAIAIFLNIHWQYARSRRLAEESASDGDARLSVWAATTAGAFAACLTTAIFLPFYSWLPIPIFLLLGLVTARSRTHKARPK